jgi:hypothetical protein
LAGEVLLNDEQDRRMVIGLAMRRSFCFLFCPVREMMRSLPVEALKQLPLASAQSLRRQWRPFSANNPPRSE